jgi:hypothetical protein
MQVSADHRAAEVSRGRHQVEIGQVQPAQLGHPKSRGVQGVHDEAIPPVGAGVHQRAD